MKSTIAQIGLGDGKERSSPIAWRAVDVRQNLLMEDPETGADGGPAGLERIPGDSDPGSEVFQRRIQEVIIPHIGILRIVSGKGGEGEFPQVRHFAIHFPRGSDELIAKTNVQVQSWADADVVLDIESGKVLPPSPRRCPSPA